MSHMMECVLVCIWYIYCVTDFCLFVLTVLHSLGQCYFCQSKYVDATSLLEECLLIQQKHLPANDVNVADSKCCV